MKRAPCRNRSGTTHLSGVPLVVPLLFDFKSPKSLVGPISQFQAVTLDEVGLRRAVLAAARAVGSDLAVIERRFKLVWPRNFPALCRLHAASIFVQLTDAPWQPTLDAKLDEASSTFFAIWKDRMSIRRRLQFTAQFKETYTKSIF